MQIRTDEQKLLSIALFLLVFCRNTTYAVLIHTLIFSPEDKKSHTHFTDYTEDYFQPTTFRVSIYSVFRHLASESWLMK